MYCFRREAIGYWVFVRNERTFKSVSESCTDHVDLQCGELHILFFLRLFSVVYHVTKRARMLAIKRLSNRLAQGRAFGIVNDHRRPRERLQSDPMQTDRQTKCANRGNTTSAAKHACEANHRLVRCQLSPPISQSPFLSLFALALILCRTASVRGA